MLYSEYAMSSSAKPVAVLVLNWNGIDLLRKFLPTWLEHTPDEAELIIVDNGSTDTSLAYLQQEYPQLRVMALGKNYGFAEGYNRAIAAVEHDTVVLLNSDVALTEGWLAEPIALLSMYPDIVAVQPKIRAYTRPDSFEYAGAAGGYIDRLGYPFCRGRLFDTLEKDCGQYDTVADIFWASGACLVIRREVYLSVGGLDPRFFAHQEEIDLCWRIQSRGGRIVAAPQSVVYHLGGGSLSMNSPRKTYLNFRNNLLMLYKNLPTATLIAVQAQRLVLDAVAAVQFAVQGRGAHAIAVLRAYWDYWRMCPQLRAERRKNLSLTKVKRPREIKSYSLVWRYFICREVTYSELPES